MMYIGHKKENGKLQLLKDHLEGVGKLAAEFARPFCGGVHARRTGLMHDLGKYSKAGQKRMMNPEHTAKVDHSTAGAQVAWDQLRDHVAAFAIAGHHGGLPDMGSGADADGATLLARRKKRLMGEMDYSAWSEEIFLEKGACNPEWLDMRDPWQVQFYTRMLFSCLVDADFLDTERFMQEGQAERSGGESMQTLLRRLQEYVEPWLKNADTVLNEKRNEILNSCLHGGEMPRGMFSLTVPTGGGKTVSSFGFALSHAVAHGLRRVIYVIPYTSIIEQNAAVFARIAGADNILEHHSNVDYFGDEFDNEDAASRKKRLASENWDAPVIVTTAVQFFESLYASKPSRCRKLHNLADSVIIFDEAQMIPLAYLRPCVAAITELVQHYGVSAVLCTATQPALDGLIHEFAPKLEIREICPEHNEMQRFFRRVSFEWEGEMSEEVLADRLSWCDQVLCVVNTRKRAQKIFELLPAESRFHLSTLMTPDHRSGVLSVIRQRLKENQPCHVVSTSLIEAGVDVDFPEVWREEAGLDSILQAAGRCNREGKRAKEESSVHIFKMEGKCPAMIRANVAAMEAAVEEGQEADSYDTIMDYFQRLYSVKNNMDAADTMKRCCRFEFKSAMEEFHLIDSDTQAIYIPTEDNREMLELLRKGIISRGLLRKLGRSAVNVYRNHLRELLSVGKIVECDGFYVLADGSLYDGECGLSLELDAGAALWV